MLNRYLRPFVFSLAFTGRVLAAPPKTVPVIPVVSKITAYGDLVDPGLNRDSCSSSLWSTNKMLWVCRDTQQVLSNGTIGPNSIVNSASFSAMPNPPNDPQQLLLNSPESFGHVFYAMEPDECGQGLCENGICYPGLCSDGSRWVGWPDTGPVVTFRGSLGVVNAYAFITQQHLSGLSVLNTTGYELYHVTSGIDLEGNILPSTTKHIDSFWTSTQIGYGSAASVVHDGFAYLYGATPNRKLAVARAVLMGLVPSLEDPSVYEYYVNGTWTRTAPVSTDPTIVLPNTSAIQGTIYYSPKWESFVSIGGDGFPDANFLISTSPKAEGPWSAPTQFYSGAVGNGSLGAYSAVAHPGLTDGTGDYIFLTWTKTHPDVNGRDVYEQPLVRVDWE
ncbi:hypothetical protein B0H16DRAFT_1793320 [Mycena metata]|uniref:DUF4185 domain-containing protein n=1 Tax=Mycena metata TaxID=1033252 RepID=A0AAD7NLJ2_9AGAR|nr:hypothetical protein B0H16DRAFT_1793320 [Mycena metata]